MKPQIVFTILFSLMSISLGAYASNPKAVEAEPKSATMAEQCQGPKKRVAILRFGGTGKYGAYEGWDVGEAIASQMGTALMSTDCFILTDRMVLSEVLREQELGLAGVTRQESTPQAGRLVGAQILIKGDITEFETGKKGNGMTLGLGLAKIPLGLRFGRNKNVAHIAIDLRLIDASTGEILFSETLTSEATTSGMAVGLDYRQASLGTDQYAKTPMGQAVRDTVVKAAGYIVQHLYGVDWTGQVVDTMGLQIFINAGSESGVEVGDTFTVTNVAKELIDPSSGVVLGRIEQEMGDIRIEQVNVKYAIARAVSDFPVRRGDYLHH
jgi:curli biogenesis system outer membrane secretion channel CsgG